MRKYFDTIVNVNSGLPVSGATVAVTTAAGLPAQLFRGDGVNPILNPTNVVTTNALGLFQFFVANGVYTLTFNYDDASTVTVETVEIVDTFPLPTLPYDVSYDIINARLMPGWTGDSAAINAALARYSWVSVGQNASGILVDATIVVPPNGRFTGSGQLTPFVRVPTLTTPTIQSGTADGTLTAGSLVLENLWVVQTGRLGYTGGALANLVTSGASHIEIYGGQAARVIGCGGYGMPHGLSFYSCGGIYIENPFFIGGVFNPLLATAQESLSQIRAASSPIGHNVNVEIVSPELYGGNSLGIQSRTIGSNTIQAKFHCGPQAGIVIESAECLTITGGFVGGFASSAVRAQAASPTDVLTRVKINGTFLDESNNNTVATICSGPTYPILDGLELNGCDMNGQLVGTNAVVASNINSVQSVRRLKIVDCQFRAFLGAPLVLLGVDNADIAGCEFAGYNLSNNTAPVFSSGIYASAMANDVHIRGCQFGGGQNAYTEGNAVDPASGLTANGCMYGVYGDTGAVGDYYDIRARNLAKAGGGLIAGTTITKATP